MTTMFYLITGISVGVEFIAEDEEDEIPNTIVLDLFIVRILFEW